MTDHTLMKRAADVWRGLDEVYQGNFTAVYGDDPAPIWVAAIATLTDEQCRQGVERIKQRRNLAMPCSLTEFETACRASSAPPMQSHRPPAYAPKPTCNPAVRDLHLASIKAKLGMAPR